MSNDDISVRINGKKYIVMSTSVSSQRQCDIKEERLREIGALPKGVKTIKQGIFSGYAIVEFFVPERMVERAGLLL